MYVYTYIYMYICIYIYIYIYICMCMYLAIKLIQGKHEINNKLIIQLIDAVCDCVSSLEHYSICHYLVNSSFWH